MQQYFKAVIISTILLGAGIATAWWTGPAAVLQTNISEPLTIARATPTYITQEESERIIQEVEALYGKKFLESVDITHLDLEQYHTYRDTVAPLELAQDDILDTELLWKLWGVLPEDTDLLEIMDTLYHNGTAGFYEDRSRRLYLVDGFGSPYTRELTLLHELVHALEDQWHDFSIHTDPWTYGGQEDALLAFDAVVEGSAMELTQRYSAKFPLKQAITVLEGIKDLGNPAMTELPPILRAKLAFPYTEGLTFWQALRAQDPELDPARIYLNPPSSTAEILHPQSYPRPLPEDIRLPAFAISMERDEGVLGEWQLREFLQQRLPSSQAAVASTGWVNDKYLLLQRNGHHTLLAMIDWESPEDGQEFEDVLRSYLEQQFGSPETGINTAVTTYGEKRSLSIYHYGSTTAFLLGDDRAMVLTVTPAINP